MLVEVAKSAESGKMVLSCTDVMDFGDISVTSLYKSGSDGSERKKGDGGGWGEGRRGNRWTDREGGW